MWLTSLDIPVFNYVAVYRILGTRYFSCHPSRVARISRRATPTNSRCRVTQNCFAPARKPVLALSLFLSLGARRLRGHAGACRRLPLFLELSGGGGASRPRKVVHYLQPCAGAITRLRAWRRSHALSFFFHLLHPLSSPPVLNRIPSLPSARSSLIDPLILISFKRHRPNCQLNLFRALIFLYSIVIFLELNEPAVRFVCTSIFIRTRLYETHLESADASARVLRKGGCDTLPFRDWDIFYVPRNFAPAISDVIQRYRRENFKAKREIVNVIRVFLFSLLKNRVISQVFRDFCNETKKIGHFNFNPKYIFRYYFQLLPNSILNFRFPGDKSLVS